MLCWTCEEPDRQPSMIGSIGVDPEAVLESFRISESGPALLDRIRRPRRQHVWCTAVPCLCPTSPIRDLLTWIRDVSMGPKP